MSPTPRDVLLQKVMDYVVVHGVGNVSLRALAAEIDTSHRMLIYHFGSREGLLTAVVDHSWGTQRAAMDELADAGPGEPADVAWRYWTLLADRSAVAPLVFELSAQAMHGATWKDAFTDGSQQLIGDMANRLQQQGEKAARARILADMWFTIVLGTLWELRLTGDRARADAIVRTFLDEAWLTQ